MKAKRILAVIVTIAMLLCSVNFTVSAEAYIAEINGQQYASMAEAIEAADGGIVSVIGNPGAFTVTEPVTIKGTGNRDYGLTDYQYITIADGIDGKVVIENIAFNGTTNHIIIFSGNDFSNLDLEIKNCYIEYNGNRGIVVDKVLKSLTVTDCTIDNTVQSYVSSYAIWANPNAPATMNISNNNIVGGNYLRGAIHVGDYAPNGSQITISGNTISGCERAVQVANQSDNVEINVTGNTFTNIAQCIGSTKSEKECAAIFVHENAAEAVEVNVNNNNADNIAAYVYSENSSEIGSFIETFDGNIADDEGVELEESTVLAGEYAATINGKYAETVQAAIDAAVVGDNEIVILPGTIDEDVVVVQTEGKNIKINGQNKVTYTGTIHISGNNRGYNHNPPALETLTIENINFNKENATSKHDFINSDRKEYVGDVLTWGYPHNVTVRNCNFKGNFDGGDVYNEEFDVVALRNAGGYNWTIENCTASGLHSFLQASANTLSSKIDRVTVTGSKSALNLGTNANYTITNCTFDVLEYAVRADANSDREVNLSAEYNNITAGEPFVIRKDQGNFDYEVNLASNRIITTIPGGEPITRTGAGADDVVSVTADRNYWGGGEPTFTTMDVGMDTYYKDEDMTQLAYTSAYEAYILAADGTETPFATFKEAMAAVVSGETVKLNKNIELEKAVSFAKDIEFTLDGNGYTISPAAGSTEANAAFNMGQGNDSTRATRKYNFTNIVFDGWTTDHVLRLQGTTSNITNCKFINTNQPDGLGIVTLTFADATVSNCVFENNVAVKAIDFNSWGDNSASACTVEDSVFKNNTVSGPAVIIYSTGSAMTVEDNEFISNTVATSGNAATVYMGFNSGITVRGNLFKNNAVTTTHATSVRVAGGVFAGAGGSAAVITENVFEGNTASSTGYPTGLPTGVTYSAYYMPGNLDGNYWDGEEPNLDVHYGHEYSDYNSLTVENYYGSYEIDANGDLVFADPRPVIAKSVALQYMLDEEASKEEGTLVYDIVVTTADDYVINRLNSADFTFALTQENGKNKYEIIDIPNDNITVNKVYNPVDGSVIEGRYEFHFDHKNNVTNDTAHAIVIAKVKLTGYGKFLFNVVEGAGTNAVHATTIVNNIVTDFTAGNGLTVNTDLDISDDYLGVIGNEIKVSKRNLTINVSFPNAVEQNEYAYQQMKLTVSGPSYERVIYLGDGVSVENNGDCLSMVNGGYKAQIVDELTLNTPYTVTLEGEGYRAVKYTVNMTEHKTLSFWNNVKDNEVYVEEGDTTGTKKYAKKVTFLAGDIVKDDEINIYDLSAVVSYFGEIDLDKDNKPQYAKYDLNRDGKIDSRDVAYVLVSWGN